MLNTMNTIVCGILYMFVLFFKMVQEVEEHQATVTALHHIGKKSGEIFKTFQGPGILCMFVYQPLAQYTETGSMKDRPCSGRSSDIC